MSDDMSDHETKGNEKNVPTNVKVLSSQKVLDPYSPIVAGLHKNRCEKCGSTESLYVHLKDGDVRNRRLDNLTILCHKCKLEEDRRIFRSILYDIVGAMYLEKEKEAVPILSEAKSKEKV